MVQGLKILKRQLKGTRKVIRGQAKGVRTIGGRTRASFKKQARKARKSTRRILTGKK